MRLIDADEIRWTNLEDGFGRIKECIAFATDIDAMPTLEIVRCKDCKHAYLSDNFGITAPWLMCKRHIGNTYKVNEDAFCSLAERKEE